MKRVADLSGLGGAFFFTAANLRLSKKIKTHALTQTFQPT